MTEIVPLKNFYQAEDYHQEYYNNNTDAGYCRVVITPKLEKLETQERDPKRAANRKIDGEGETTSSP